MNKNPLSVWTFPYRKSYYLTHPWKWFKDLYWNIRNFWHRGRYGYAYVDVWNFGEWYPRVAAGALRYLAEHASGYPGVEPWETPEKWERHLKELAIKLDKCADTLYFDSTDERNEYAKEFYDTHEHLIHHREELPNGCIRTWTDETPEYKELREKYWNRMKELAEEDTRFCREVYTFLGENLGRYWD